MLADLAARQGVPVEALAGGESKPQEEEDLESMLVLEPDPSSAAGQRAAAGEPEDPLPEWLPTVELMRTKGWTEQQVLTQNSPAMIYRMLILDQIEAEHRERLEKKQAKSNVQLPVRQFGMAPSSSRSPVRR